MQRWLQYPMDLIRTSGSEGILLASLMPGKLTGAGNRRGKGWTKETVMICCTRLKWSSSSSTLYHVVKFQKIGRR